MKILSMMKCRGQINNKNINKYPPGVENLFLVFSPDYHLMHETEPLRSLTYIVLMDEARITEKKSYNIVFTKKK
jgi:hypothetical protein